MVVVPVTNMFFDNRSPNILEINKVDAVNLMVHVFNSIIMLIDLTIVGHPIKLSHVTWTMGIGLVYSIFTAIYFLSGGTTR